MQWFETNQFSSLIYRISTWWTMWSGAFWRRRPQKTPRHRRRPEVRSPAYLGRNQFGDPCGGCREFQETSPDLYRRMKGLFSVKVTILVYLCVLNDVILLVFPNESFYLCKHCFFAPKFSPHLVFIKWHSWIITIINQLL